MQSHNSDINRDAPQTNDTLPRRGFLAAGSAALTSGIGTAVFGSAAAEQPEMIVTGDGHYHVRVSGTIDPNVDDNDIVDGGSIFGSVAENGSDSFPYTGRIREIEWFGDLEFSVDDEIVQSGSRDGKIDARITDFDVGSNTVSAGDTQTSTIRIESTSDIRHKFWFGYSVIDPNGSNRYNGDGSVPNVTLDPYESGAANVSWTVPSNAPEGRYGAIGTVREWWDGNEFSEVLDSAETNSSFNVDHQSSNPNPNSDPPSNGNEGFRGTGLAVDNWYYDDSQQRVEVYFRNVTDRPIRNVQILVQELYSDGSVEENNQQSYGYVGPRQNGMTWHNIDGWYNASKVWLYSNRLEGNDYVLYDSNY